MKRVDLRLYFEPRDIWVGVYWTKDYNIWRMYVCILPMFPIRISWWAKEALE